MTLLFGYVRKPSALTLPLLSLVQANTIKFYNLKPGTSARVSKLANQFWLSGILFSITFGLLKVRNKRA